MNTIPSKSNPLVDVVCGKEVHQYNDVKIRFHHSLFAHLVRQACALNIDVVSLLKLRMGPCQCCGHDKIEITLNTIPSRSSQTKTKENNGQSSQGHL